TVVPTAEGNTSAGKAIYPRLRAHLAGLPAEVGGSSAQDIDFNHAVYGSFPLMLALIALITFVLLTRAFRSPILALKAVLLNIFSNLIWGVPASPKRKAKTRIGTNSRIEWVRHQRGDHPLPSARRRRLARGVRCA